jgi:hypothetical protein
MRTLKRIVKYVFRTWQEEPEPAHPLIKVLPPFFIDLLGWTFVVGLLYSLGSFLWSII